MSEYLSKEEIKQWRSSLEKITLEEFAARLGKKLEEEKPTNDLADIVLHGQPVVSYNENWTSTKTERITTIAQRAFDRENEIMPSPFSISKLKLSLDDEKSGSSPKTKSSSSKFDKALTSAPKAEKKQVKETIHKSTQKAAKTPKPDKVQSAINEVLENKKTGDEFRDEVRIVLKKALTDREQKVFDYFAEHKNEVVYAKDLAVLLDLPRDYVYKYIKNLRAKIDGDALENAVKGGFILHV